MSLLSVNMAIVGITESHSLVMSSNPWLWQTGRGRRMLGGPYARMSAYSGGRARCGRPGL